MSDMLIKTIQYWMQGKEPITLTKLQYMLYFSQHWVITMYNHVEDIPEDDNWVTLFPDPIVANAHDVRIQEVEYLYAAYGETLDINTKMPDLPEEILSVLGEVRTIFWKEPEHILRKKITKDHHAYSNAWILDEKHILKHQDMFAQGITELTGSNS